MRSSIARRRRVRPVADLAIGVTLVCTVTFFIVEYCIGTANSAVPTAIA